MKKVALYIRVSTEEQALHGDSLEAQRASLLEYAKNHNFLVVDIYVDEGYSARKPYRKRHEFMRLLEDVEQNKFELIIFTKLDRWFRNVKDYYAIQTILESHNVAWKTTDEDYDTTTANGRLHLNIKLSISQDEADRTSERIKFVFANKAKRGEVLSGSAPLGYKVVNKRLVIDPEKAYIAKDVFEHYSTSQSKHGTVIYIQDKYGISVSYGMISNMLINTVYKGIKHENPEFCKPIVTTELWEKVQEINSKNIKRPPTRRVYLFAGLLHCPICGMKLSGKMTQEKRNNKIYEYEYYRCGRHYASRRCSCTKHVSEAVIERYLLSHIRVDVEKYIVGYNNQLKNEKPAIDTVKIKRQIDKLKELYLEDLIDKDTYKRDYEDCQNKLQEAERAKTLKPLSMDKFNKFLREDFAEQYKAMERTEQRLLWRSIIKQIRFDTNNNLQIFL